MSGHVSFLRRAKWLLEPQLVVQAVAVICLVAVVLRPVRHPVPLPDLTSLRVPTLWLSYLAMLLFTPAFGSMLFGNVLFLTGPWHQSVIVAGLWLTPGPVMVVVVSLTVGGRLVNGWGRARWPRSGVCRSWSARRSGWRRRWPAR